MDLTKMTVEEIKAIGFDLISQNVQIQQNLQSIQMELQKRQQEINGVLE